MISADLALTIMELVGSRLSLTVSGVAVRAVLPRPVATVVVAVLYRRRYLARCEPPGSMMLGPAVIGLADALAMQVRALNRQGFGVEMLANHLGIPVCLVEHLLTRSFCGCGVRHAGITGRSGNAR